MSEQPPIHVHFAVTESGVDRPELFITVAVEVNRYGDPGAFAFDRVHRAIQEATIRALAQRYAP